MSELQSDVEVSWLAADATEPAAQPPTISNSNTPCQADGGRDTRTSPEEPLVAAVATRYWATLFGVLRHERLPVIEVRIEAGGTGSRLPGRRQVRAPHGRLVQRRDSLQASRRASLRCSRDADRCPVLEERGERACLDEQLVDSVPEAAHVRGCDDRGGIVRRVPGRVSCGRSSRIVRRYGCSAADDVGKAGGAQAAGEPLLGRDQEAVEGQAPVQEQTSRGARNVPRAPRRRCNQDVVVRELVDRPCQAVASARSGLRLEYSAGRATRVPARVRRSARRSLCLRSSRRGRRTF
jgi:hypothetical protein